MSEYYPLTLSYTDAVCSPTDTRGLRDGYNMDFIHGLYRIGDETLLEIAVQWAYFPSFCGGSYAHSPVARIVQNRGWGGGCLGRGVRVEIEDVKEVTDLIDLRTKVEGCESWSNQEWVDYGYRALANGMFARMAFDGKRGVVLSGPDHGEIAKFMQQMVKVDNIRTAQASVGKLPWDGYDRVHTRSVQTSPLYVQVQETAPFCNFNSGNDCYFYPVVLTTDLLGGEEGRNNEEEARDRAYSDWYAQYGDDDEYYFDDWYDDHYSEYQASGDVETNSLPNDEMDYAKAAGKYARRYTWCN